MILGGKRVTSKSRKEELVVSTITIFLICLGIASTLIK